MKVTNRDITLTKREAGEVARHGESSMTGWAVAELAIAISLEHDHEVFVYDDEGNTIQVVRATQAAVYPYFTRALRRWLRAVTYRRAVSALAALARREAKDALESESRKSYALGYTQDAETISSIEDSINN